MTPRSQHHWLNMVQRVAEAPTENFAQLVQVAGLSPRTELQFGDFSGASFRDCNLQGYNFFGAKLYSCDFTGALIEGARFDQAVLDRVGVPVHLRTNLRQASDWDAYLKSWKRASRLPSDRHLLPGMVFQDGPIGPELVVVPAGEYWMGSPDGTGGDQGDSPEPERFSDEGPRHRVTIPRPFAVGRFAVTFHEWETCQNLGGTKHRPSAEGSGRGKHPVINVSWNDITQDYLPWLNRTTGHSYRLLTEEEWEYCARAGSDTAFWWGPRVAESNASFDTGGIRPGDHTRRGTVPVDRYDPNTWGLYNVHGNIFEWCQDPWRDNYSEPLPPANFPRNIAKRAVRGGSFASSTQAVRAAYRQGTKATDRLFNLGFRLARDLNS